MAINEETPLLREPTTESPAWLSPANRVLTAGFLISVALSFTQVPILYAFRIMECEQFYNQVSDSTPKRCNRSEIDAETATQVSLLGISTTFFGILNLFFSGWQIKTWGPKRALIVQTAFPALRVAVQVLGLSVGAKDGIIIVQFSQIITLVGGMSGYLLALNTAAGEIVAVRERTSMFGMLQGSVMLGTSVGYLLGGIVGDTWGIRRPFEIATVLFSLSSVYSAALLPYIDPATLTGNPKVKQDGWRNLSGGLKVLLPKRLCLKNGRHTNYYGITFLALGVFMGVLATGYAPYLIQMYSTATFKFLPRENGFLMASNSLIRGFFLIFAFPKIISSGRRWFGSQESASHVPSPSVSHHHPENTANKASGQEFDLFFLRWSLVVDGLITASTAFATQGLHIYLAGLLLPLASGSAPASKGVITEMCPPSERTMALQAMTLVENIAMLSTLGLFGFIFSTFSNMGKAYITFYVNAAAALVAVAILTLSRFPPARRTLDLIEDEDE